jgi:hypothetical protein
MSKLANSDWINVHTLLVHTGNDEAKFENAFIQQLGERFDSLKNLELLQFAEDMAEANLNQEDIIDAIVDRFIRDEGPAEEKFNDMGFPSYIKLLTVIIDLNLHKSATFEKLIKASEAYNAKIDKTMFLSFNDKVFALRAIVSRHAYKDEKIKPFVSISFNLNSFQILKPMNSSRLPVVSSRTVRDSLIG